VRNTPGYVTKDQLAAERREKAQQRRRDAYLWWKNASPEERARYHREVGKLARIQLPDPDNPFDP